MHNTAEIVEEIRRRLIGDQNGVSQQRLFSGFQPRQTPWSSFRTRYAPWNTTRNEESSE